MYYYKVAESGTQHKPSFPQDQGLSCCPHSQQHSYEDISDHSSVKRTVASNFDIFFFKWWQNAQVGIYFNNLIYLE